MERDACRANDDAKNGRQKVSNVNAGILKITKNRDRDKGEARDTQEI